MSPLVVMWTALEVGRAGLGSGGSVCSLLLVVCALDSAAAFCLFGIALNCAMGTGAYATRCSAARHRTLRPREPGHVLVH